MSHIYILAEPVLTATSQPAHFYFFTYSHPCQMQYSSLKISIFVYCLHKCCAHLVTWSHVGVFSPTRVMDKGGCGSNDGLHQSSVKLGMPRKTVDTEDNYFSWRTCNYGRIQLPGFLEMLSRSPASCSLSLSPTAPRTLCSTLSRHGFNTAAPSSQTAGLATYVCPRRHTHNTVNHTTNLINQCTGAHMNPDVVTWKHIKVALNPYNQRTHYV